jgi:predicted MFS family arabinose efflux permease
MDGLDKFIPLFLNGGWVVLLIGAAGMIARLVTSKNPDEKTLAHAMSNILAAMLTSMIAWFMLEQFAIEPIYKALIYGLAGLNSPEILGGVIKLSTKFSDDPSGFISSVKSGNIPGTKKKTPVRKPRVTKK